MPYLQWLAEDGTSRPLHTFEVRSEDVVLGRAADVGLAIEDPSVSRQHARLVRTAEGWLLIALSQTNGVKVSGRPVDRVALHEGTTFRMGNVSLRFCEADPRQARTIFVDGAERAGLPSDANAVADGRTHAASPRPEASSAPAGPASARAEPGPAVSTSPPVASAPSRPDSLLPRRRGGRMKWFIALGCIGGAAWWWRAPLSRLAEEVSARVESATAASSDSTSTPDVLAPKPLPSGAAADVPEGGEAAFVPGGPMLLAAGACPAAGATPSSSDARALVTSRGQPNAFMWALGAGGKPLEELWHYAGSGDAVVFIDGVFQGGRRSKRASAVASKVALTPWASATRRTLACLAQDLGPLMWETTAVVLPGINDDRVATVWRLAQGGQAIVVDDVAVMVAHDPAQKVAAPETTSSWAGVLQDAAGEAQWGARVLHAAAARLLLSPRGQGTTDDGTEYVLELPSGLGVTALNELKVARVGRDGDESPVTATGRLTLTELPQSRGVRVALVGDLGASQGLQLEGVVLPTILAATAKKEGT